MVLPQKWPLLRVAILQNRWKLLKLKKRMKTLIILWLITLCLLAATVYPTVKYFTGQSFLLPGQNYTTITYAESADP